MHDTVPMKRAGQEEGLILEPEINSILPLKLTEVSLSIDNAVLLDRVSHCFDGDKTHVLVGPNGAGKSMLVKVCHGLIQPTSGSITWADPDAARSPKAQALVFQQPVMFRRSVAKNVLYAMSVCGVAPNEFNTRLEQALDLTGLTNLADRMATRLSGGEQQRLALARCWAVRPKVLFLDEPTAHIDHTATRMIENIIQSIRLSGTAVIMVTHDFGQAKRLGDQIIFMHQGKIEEAASKESFFAQPQTIAAQRFLEGELL